MAKYTVMTWYTCVEYGKCWQTVEADSSEQAKEIAHESGEWEGFKCKGQGDFDFDWDETEVYEETDND